MNEYVMIASYVMLDDTLRALGHMSDVRAVVSDAEVVGGGGGSVVFRQSSGTGAVCGARHGLHPTTAECVALQSTVTRAMRPTAPGFGDVDRLGA